MASALSLSTLAPNPPPTLAALHFSYSRPNISFLSHSLSSLKLRLPNHRTSSQFIAKSTDTEAPVSLVAPETETEAETETAAETVVDVEASEPKRDEVFAVVMVGSRQYIVFPGRFLYTQRLKGANVNDKITLNKVLLVGTKTSTYIGKPIVPNTTVHAVVEEQKKDRKVIVFKYKKKKNYRRNIGHRQPITRIRITSIEGYQDTPAVTLE